jgi:hypothetical protein
MLARLDWVFVWSLFHCGKDAIFADALRVLRLVEVEPIRDVDQAFKVVFSKVAHSQVPEDKAGVDAIGGCGCFDGRLRWFS